MRIIAEKERCDISYEATTLMIGYSAWKYATGEPCEAEIRAFFGGTCKDIGHYDTVEDAENELKSIRRAYICGHKVYYMGNGKVEL